MRRRQVGKLIEELERATIAVHDCRRHATLEFMARVRNVQSATAVLEYAEALQVEAAEIEKIARARIADMVREQARVTRLDERH